MKSTLDTHVLERTKVPHENIIDRDVSGKRSHAKVSPTRRKMIISFFIVCVFVVSFVQLLMLQSLNSSESLPHPARIAVTPHDPILIVGNGDFEISDAVRGGSGTPSDPYIISDWSIDATDMNGIYIIGTDVNFIIRNVTINATLPNNDAILLEGVTDAQIRNVTLTDCARGIAMTTSCSRIVIDRSTIANNTNSGIATQYGTTSFVDITNNVLSGNGGTGGTGIALDTTTGFNIAGNDVSKNDPSSLSRRAVTLTKCSSGVITGNNLSAIYNDALYCSASQNIVVANNSFSSVWTYGIYMRECSGFLIYHNNFLGAIPHAFDNWGPENAWNASYPIGGNYWADYSGVDMMHGPNQDISGPDGIGDTDYVIDVNTTDHYPLMMSGIIEPIPEFPTPLLPIISVLALLFAVVRRSPRKDF